MTRLKPNIVEVGTIDLTEVDNAVKLFYDLSKNGDNAIKKLKDSLFATLFRIGRRFIPTGDLKLNNYPHLNILTVYILGNPEIYVMTVEDGHIYRTDFNENQANILRLHTLLGLVGQNEDEIQLRIRLWAARCVRDWKQFQTC